MLIRLTLAAATLTGCVLPPHDPDRAPDRTGEDTAPAVLSPVPHPDLLLITPADGGPVMSTPAGDLIWGPDGWTPVHNFPATQFGG